MAVAPAVLMTGIGVHARTYIDPFEWPALQEDHARTNAYIPLVIETFDRLQSTGPENAVALRRLAFKWVEGGQNGSLKPLVPTLFDEDSISGTKATVVDANQIVAKRLVHEAEANIQAKQYDQALDDLILATEVVKCLQYSSFISLYRSHLLHSSVLYRIEAIYSELDDAQKERLIACMNSMTVDDQQIKKITGRAKHLAQLAVEQYKKIQAVGHGPQGNDESNAFFEHPALAKVSSASGYGATDGASLGFSFEADQCILAGQRNRLIIDRIMSLSSRPTP